MRLVVKTAGAMRVFLDVGGHYGESLDVALDPRWGFAKVYSFEPAQACLRLLRGFRDPRVHVVPAGLSNKDGSATLFGPGLLGASVYADKCPPADARPAPTSVRDETIRLVRATDWLLANTSADDEIYLKLNCEGSECDVLEDLLDSGAIDRIHSIYVDFDVRKIPSQAHRQDGVERRLRELGCDFFTPETLAGPGGSRTVRAWLATAGPRNRAGARVAFSGLRYRLGLHRPPYIWATSVLRSALPASTYSWAARSFGRQARRPAGVKAG
jgi:FkbM family methyltransferase